MAIRVDVYTSGGMASGYLGRPGPLRDALEASGGLPLDRTAWLALDAPAAETAGSVTIPADDILVAVDDDDPATPVHASWHRISLDAGPYVVEGDLPTMPGFDPGRALTRPSGEFVMLRDVTLSIPDRPDIGTASGDHALVNRYAVERIRAELMLGFFFPGAVVEAVEGGVGIRPQAADLNATPNVTPDAAPAGPLPG
jgi:hypothetical protein